MREASSFRDPSGYVYYEGGAVFRQVNECYRPQYERLMASGLYEKLDGLLIRHAEAADAAPRSADGFLVIKPEKIPFISYPYEWSFGQLKDAALLTLEIQRRAVDLDMILKDASAYNVQFLNGQAVFIDTLSFDFYREGQPWVAYGQFCRHFLAPLFLMAHVDERLSQLLRVYIDGLPLDLAAKLLGGRGGFAATQHLRWHARAAQRHGEDGKRAGRARVAHISKFNYIALIDSLIRIVQGLSVKGVITEWGDYYAHTNYAQAAGARKEALVREFLDEIAPSNTWDFGANDGRYSRLALARGGHVVAFDIDPVAVARNYAAVKSSRENMLPLLLDLTNPSPAIGFENAERGTIENRQRPDAVLMLAVIHHIAISNNLPLPRVAAWAADLTDHLVIEFVPKSDSQVKTLLATRDDIFPDYDERGFEAAFSERFTIARREKIDGSERTLYLMTKKRASDEK
jgi:hypothetical protein